MDCTKAVLEARCNYRVAIQEAKMIRGNWLQELEIAYSKALGEAAAVRSSQSVTLHREHVRLMQELEEQAISSPNAMQEGPSSSKRWKTPIWFASLKPSCMEAFSQDSDIIKEARLCFFSNHSCDWVTDGTNDLSDVSKVLAESDN